MHATTRRVLAEQIYEDRGSTGVFPRCGPTRQCAWLTACPGPLRPGWRQWLLREPPYGHSWYDLYSWLIE